MKYSHPCVPYLVDNRPRLNPVLLQIIRPPCIKCCNYPVYYLLFLSRFWKVHSALFIEPGKDLFEFIDSVVLNIMADLLQFRKLV